MIPVVVALFLLLIKSKKSEKVFLIGLASSMGLSILWFLFLFAAATIAGWKNASLIVLTFISMGLLSYAIVIRSSDLCITGKSYIYRTISLVTLLASIFVGAFWIMLKLIEVSP